MQFFIDNWVLFLAAISSGAMLAWPMLSRGSVGGGKVSPTEAVQLINREKAMLIDVSESAEFASAHVAGAKNVPLGSLESSNDLPKNKTLPLVLVCPTGARAARAVGMLKKRGFEKTSVLAGGLRAWRDANLPIEKSA
ncbi:MAG: rhodanese-like domain-containing protein [Burkholderiaceae bacterium]